MPIEPGLTVDEVMQRWPATIRTFLDYGMRCVGCPIGQFHTITDACREHGVDRAAFLAALRAQAASTAPWISRPFPRSGRTACEDRE